MSPFTRNDAMKYRIKEEKLGEQRSMILKIKWENPLGLLIEQTGNFDGRREVPGGNDLSLCISPEGLQRLNILAKRCKHLNGPHSTSPYYSFNNKNLNDIRADVGSIIYYNDKCWDCDIEEEPGPSGATSSKPLGRMKISNVNVTHGTNSHTVFDSVEFKNVIVELKFQGSTAVKRIYLDTSSPHYISGLTPIVDRYAGVHGVSKNMNRMDDKYQCGFAQKFRYYLKCGNKIIALWITYSFVFKYPYNDFEPAGTVSANVVYPQIEFFHTIFNEEDLDRFFPNSSDYSEEFSYIKDITSNLPTGVIANNVSVAGYKGRVKMVVSVNSKHHVSDQLISGILYDGNYLGTLRDQGINKIPEMFEKYLHPNYYNIDNNNVSILNFFTDSNINRKSQRLLAPYEGVFGVFPPFWHNIFDYNKYNVDHCLEFDAVHGWQSPNSGKFNNGIFYTSENNYPYPLTNTQNASIELIKVERQGQYDNIHFHGYLGHYKDNNQIIIHAPVCGFCCFHLHWRWSAINSDIASGPLMKFVKGFNNSINYKGWGINENGHLTSNVEKGAPLIPWNQHLKIAATNPTDDPHNEEDTVVEGGVGGILAADKKAIWYSVSVMDTGPQSSHVVMEQGCGYAFEYSKFAEGIRNKSIQWTSATQPPSPTSNNMPIAYPEDYFTGYIFNEFGFNSSSYYDYHNAITNITSSNTLAQVVAARFEIQYRLMRFFNKNVSSPTNPLYNTNAAYNNYDQVPTNWTYSNTVAPNLKSMEDL